jgi:hypothetical protein
MRLRLHTHAARALVIVAALGLVAAACGDDDDTAAEDTGSDTTETSAEPTSEFCDQIIEAITYLDSDDLDPARAQELFSTASASAPGDTGAAVDTVFAKYQEAFGGGGNPDEAFFTLLSDEEFGAATEDIDAAMESECGHQPIDLVTEDYAFSGAPETLEAGNYTLDIDNQGTELHEAILFRVNDDVDLGAEELLALPERESETMVTPAGESFALPGLSGISDYIELEPGRYVMACFIPVGLTPEVAQSGQEPEGAPHHTEGMFAEFTVE